MYRFLKCSIENHHLHLSSLYVGSIMTFRGFQLEACSRSIQPSNRPCFSTLPIGVWGKTCSLGRQPLALSSRSRRRKKRKKWAWGQCQADVLGLGPRRRHPSPNRNLEFNQRNGSRIGCDTLRRLSGSRGRAYPCLTDSYKYLKDPWTSSQFARHSKATEQQWPTYEYS